MRLGQTLQTTQYKNNKTIKYQLPPNGKLKFQHQGRIGYPLRAIRCVRVLVNTRSW